MPILNYTGIMRKDPTMIPIPWLSLVLIPILILAGCVPVSPTIQPTQKMDLPSPTYLPATNTISPSSSKTPTITETLSPTATQTLIITLEPESVKETMQPLLHNPMNCTVACFLGITPGKTYLNEVRDFFNPLGLTHKEGTDPKSGKYVYSVAYESSIGRDSSVIFFTSNGLVENIIVMPEIRIQNEGGLREWIPYSPETLIKKYGEPSLVDFILVWGQNNSTEIDMIMYFNDVNLIIFYQENNIVHDHSHSPILCPLIAQFEHIELWMGPNPPLLPSFDANSLEVATSLTMDQFTQLMLGDPKQACFTIKGEVFP